MLCTLHALLGPAAVSAEGSRCVAGALLRIGGRGEMELLLPAGWLLHPLAHADRCLLLTLTALQDEVLAHRLGLIPLRVDPRLFQYRVGRAGIAGE